MRRARDKDHKQLFDKDKINCPSIHIWGEQDILKEKSSDAVSCCENPLVITHRSGHKVPHISTINVDAIKDMMHSATHKGMQSTL